MSSNIASEFVGTWRLVSYSTATSGGEISYPMGRNAKGRLVYDASGRITVQIGNPNRTDFSAGDLLVVTDAQARAAFEGFLAYYGSYTIHADQNTVVHHLEMSSIPNWTGHDQIRHFELQEGRLTLKTPPMILGGTERVATLVWEKLP